MGRRERFDHAVVIGGSMAGLLAARVLGDHFRRVAILERDPVHDYPESRKGQPQTRHLHGLLAAGLQTMLAYFPDLREALAAAGSYTGDMGEGMNWYTHGGYRRRLHLGMDGATMSRPFLEHLVRQRVRALPNVSLRDNCAVRELLSTADRAQVTGVVVEQRATSEAAELRADLVVDCSGRASRAPQWLEALGYAAAPETVVQVNVGYASRLYRRDPADPRGAQWTLYTPEAPAETRFAGLFPIEGDRWIVSMGGWNGDYAPADEAGFLAYARSLPMPDIYQVISRAEPASEIVAHRYRASRRRHYERLDRFPDGLLVLGDALCSFNPTYGQGMTSAAVQAQALDRLLAEGRAGLDDLAPAFFRRAAKVVDIPWQLSVGEDFRFPGTVGEKPRGIDVINRYVARVHRATHHDEVVSRAFLRVMNLLAPPQSLFHPRIVWRVLRNQRSAVSRQPFAVSYQPPASG